MNHWLRNATQCSVQNIVPFEDRSQNFNRIRCAKKEEEKQK